METATVTNTDADNSSKPCMLFDRDTDKMEDDQFSSNLPTESAHLVKAFLERHSRAKERADDSPEGKMKGVISWVSCRDFTVEEGKRQIEEYITTWELQPCWLHSLDFLCSTEGDHHTFHHYRARFSTPTQRRPVLGTASVYFTVAASKVRPRSEPVEVRFVLESGRLVHTPGWRTRLRECWLADTIESKAMLRRAVNL